MSDIARKLRKIRDDRSAEMRRRMEAYDAEVFQPAVKAVQDECAAAGHGPTRTECNGIGWNWRRCTLCDARVEQWPDEARST